MAHPNNRHFSARFSFGFITLGHSAVKAVLSVPERTTSCHFRYLSDEHYGSAISILTWKNKNEAE
jgi:hypothetical protein